jgi:transcriptional regulator with GAF, ATPase, and Fis domain
VETIKAVACRKCSIVITGETGTGKEMVARQLHLSSDRANQTFIPVDCTTLTGELFESQLFGHVKGAFTGAVDNTLGFFRAADNGTIFLDEVGEIPLDLQAKLLRVLQEGTVTPLGSTKSYHVDVRVICATNRDLKQMVSEGTFRADLYYRLNVITIEIPPLKQRPDDIEILAKYFLARQSAFYNEPEKTLSSETKKLFVNYSWPGNIRELANVIERAYVLTIGNEIQPSALPMELLIAGVPKGSSVIPTIEQAKRQLVIQALMHTKGQKEAAAQMLGIERRALNRLVKKFNISLHQIKHSTHKN